MNELTLKQKSQLERLNKELEGWYREVVQTELWINDESEFRLVVRGEAHKSYMTADGGSGVRERLTGEYQELRISSFTDRRRVRVMMDSVDERRQVENSQPGFDHRG